MIIVKDSKDLSRTFSTLTVASVLCASARSGQT
jgi:hypothetical protein